MKAGSAVPLSVCLITLNEERRLLACLESLPGGAEIIVVDSGSSDRTVEIARNFGAKVETRRFEGYAHQKNAALALAKEPWVLSVDADEVLTGTLRDEVSRVVSANDQAAGAFEVRRQLVFMGRALRFGKSVDRPVRLFRRGSGQFVSEIHEQLVLKAGVRVGQLKSTLLHYSYEDLEDYFARFNDYTSKIAHNHRTRGRAVSRVGHVLRPWGEFLSRYLLRLGFLDGYEGYTYALVSSLYAYVKYAKLIELNRAKGELVR